MKTSEKIINIASEIEATLKKQQYPGPNETIPYKIRDLAEQLRELHPCAADYARKIARLATDFYSARKHEKSRGGANMLWTKMKLHTNEIRHIGEIMERDGE